MCDFMIAVTGHRPNRLPESARDAVRRQIGALLDEILGVTGKQDRQPVLVSALAEGADRMAADAALERGMALRAVLPFVPDEYAKDFPDAFSRKHFMALLTAAQSVTALAGDANDRDSAYEAAGQAMLVGADMLIAIWDGKPAAGRGGTAEVVAEAVERGLPVAVIDAAAAEVPRMLSGSGSIGDAVHEAIGH